MRTSGIEDVRMEVEMRMPLAKTFARQAADSAAFERSSSKGSKRIGILSQSKRTDKFGRLAGSLSD